MLVPPTFGVAFGDGPRYRYGATTVDYTYAENGKVDGESSGIHSHSYLSSLPPLNHPTHQEGETALHLYVNSLASPLGSMFVAPFPQSLAPVSGAWCSP